MPLTSDDRAKIDEEIKKMEIDTDGSGTPSGSAPIPGEDATASTSEMLKDVIGEEPEGPFNIADAVNDDEKAIQSGDIGDDEESETEEGEEGTPNPIDSVVIDPDLTPQEDDSEE